MKFGAPEQLALMWIIPLVTIFFIIALRSRKKAMRIFFENTVLSEASSDFNLGNKKVKYTILVLAILLVVTAQARPQWGFSWQEVKRKGIDIIIVLDTSNSMLAEDVLPNRLERSKLAIKDLVKKIRGDRIGLVVFSGNAFLQCPLTVDYDGFFLALDDVDVDIIPVGGTSISRAIKTASNSFEKESKGEKIVILITDGEDLEGGVENAIDTAKRSGIKIFCAGIGSTEGELVPVKDNAGRVSFLKDAEGNVVKTRLNEDVLKKMAVKTGGIYVRGSGAEIGLNTIYDEKLSKLEKQEFKIKMEKKYHERFQIFLAFALLLLFIEPLIGDRRMVR